MLALFPRYLFIHMNLLTPNNYYCHYFLFYRRALHAPSLVLMEDPYSSMFLIVFRGAAMRFLGAGACSVVMALSEEEAREWCDSVPAPLLWQLALRLSTRITRCCPVCCDLLTDFVGFQFDIEITENLKGRCAAAYPPLADRCMTALHAQLITNFSFDPRLIQECCTPHNYIGASSGIARLGISQRSGLTIEVKPKGLWKFPSVVGIVVDSVEYYLHPMKLRQCRYSLMQLLKCKKRSGACPATSSDRSSYCPNHLMLGDESSIVVALRRLVEQPANNMGVVSEGHTLEDISEESLHVVSVALHRSGVLPRLADLQLFGSASDHEIPVLDVELLFRWSTARDMSSVKWIVTVPSEPALPSADCCCQSGIHPLCGTTTQKRSFNTRFIAPMLDFGECVKRFYASMTAKDVSLLVSLSSLAEGVLSSCLKPPSSPVAELSATSGGITSEEVSSFRYAHGGVVVSVGHPAVAVCRVGVVDVDDKSHKSLSHYFHRDHEVLAAWEEYCLLNPSSSHH
uniref:Inositol-pentakisphosphate 2-kinase n=1 Tax=Trypanosoma congolense (strain IL3000) TaxID=1068625 RepID=G0UKS8_TRYCI|nr:conserved hypothetical protein [Trypanosoma congolense IL3000]